MSIEADDKEGESIKRDTADEQLVYLKVIAYILAEMHSLDLNQIVNDMRNSQ